MQDAKPRMWKVRAEDGTTFGPATLASLQAWARDGRLAPSHMISSDEKTWEPVTSIRELGMDWVAEISPGTFYGPIHAQALEELIRDGSIAQDVVRFSRTKASAVPDPKLVAKQEEMERSLEALRAAFTKRVETQQQELRAITAEREQLKGALDTKDMEFEAERQAFKAAESRLQADLAKVRATATSLVQQIEQSKERDREQAAMAAKLTELETRLADVDNRKKATEDAHKEALQQARQAQREAEKLLLEERAAQAQREQEMQSLGETLKSMRMRQESLRKLLQQAGTLLSEESPFNETVIEDGVVTTTSPPPRDKLASLNQLESQAQREISSLGLKGNLFGKRK